MLMYEIVLCAIGVRHVSITVFLGLSSTHAGDDPSMISYGWATVSKVGDHPCELPLGRRNSIIHLWGSGVMTIGGGREVVLTEMKRDSQPTLRTQSSRR